MKKILTLLFILLSTNVSYATVRIVIEASEKDALSIRDYLLTKGYRSDGLGVFSQSVVQEPEPRFTVPEITEEHLKFGAMILIAIVLFLVIRLIYILIKNRVNRDDEDEYFEYEEYPVRYNFNNYEYHTMNLSQRINHYEPSQVWPNQQNYPQENTYQNYQYIRGNR